MSFPMTGQDSSVGTSVGDSGGASQGGDNGNSNGLHPAWNEVLSVIPPELHSQVTPHLRNHDLNTQRVHERYNPYKDLADKRVDPNRIQQALTVADAIEQNPEAIYKLLHEQFGGQQQQSQGLAGQQQQQNPQLQQQGGQDDPYEGLHPQVAEQLRQIAELKSGFDTLAQLQLNQRQQSQQEEEDAQLQALYDSIESRNPVFKALNVDGAAEPYINNLLLGGLSPEDAEKQFMAFIDSVKTQANRPSPPVLLGSGGTGMPGQQPINPSSLTNKGTKDLVAAMLEANRAANQ
jgi:hypothetical protein